MKIWAYCKVPQNPVQFVKSSMNCQRPAAASEVAPGDGFGRSRIGQPSCIGELL